MTRISGTRIIESPCCQTQYSTPDYGSVNLSAYEFWTDGRRVGSLFSGDGGLRRCVCGAYFLLHMCDHIQTIPKTAYKPRAPKGWQNTQSNWWTRFWGKPTLGDCLLNYDIRTDEEIQAVEADMPPQTSYVADADMTDVIERCSGNREMQIIARRRMWQYLNDPFREVYRQHKEVSQDTFPHFEAGLEQKENMLKLAYLLEDGYGPTWLELAELFREVGDMEAAAKALARAGKSDETLTEVMGQLIEMNYSGPARFRY
jgi:hypothetical protein